MQFDFYHGGLIHTHGYDQECRMLADRHYSRQQHGSAQFVPPGRRIVLRDAAGLVVFVWSWPEHRRDNQTGYCCTLFRNESDRQSSGIIIEAENYAARLWGPGRMFTYVDALKVRSTNPGYCFQCAGWRKAGRSKVNGLMLLVKE